MHVLKDINPRFLAFLWLTLWSLLPASVRADVPLVILPDSRLNSALLAVIVNDDDPLSVRIGAYYQQQRNIPPANIIRVSFNAKKKIMPPQDFKLLHEEIYKKSPPHIQAYALTWMHPFRVGCMSITTAIAAGFDKKWCSSERCAPTHRNPAFNSLTHAPYTDHGIRPTMTIAAADFSAAKKLIDRGILADGSNPPGTAYLLSTKDKSRNVRAFHFKNIKRRFDNRLKTEVIESNTLRDRDDVLFYFTGLAWVRDLHTLRFRPGAIADHLTSAGGNLSGHSQMSSLKWLEAGATGSYGTVVEPCNLRGKFPNPMLVIGYYLIGDTLLEAYWKSVAMPGEGIFIGEPLATPFANYRITDRGKDYQLETRSLAPGVYILETALAPVGPYRREKFMLRVQAGQTRLHLPKIPGRRVYKLTAAGQSHLQ